MNFMERIIGMITKPDATTKDIAREPRIEEGLLIVGLLMIIMIVGAYLRISRMNIIGGVQGMDSSTYGMILLVSGIV